MIGIFSLSDQRLDKSYAFFFLGMPAFVLVILPIGCLVVASVYGGHNLISPAFAAMEPVRSVVAGISMISVVPLARAIMIIVFADVVKDFSRSRYYFEFEHEMFFMWHLSRTERMLWLAFYFGGLLCGVTALADHFFR